jgi:uncharacterized damage-inducible protein DinB
MADVRQQLIEIQRQKLDDLRRRAAEAIGQLGDEEVNWRPNEESNSIANLVVHMAGNIGQRFTAGIGGAPDVRDRDAEFNTRERFTRSRILAVLNEAFGAADKVMAGLTPERLDDPQQMRDRQVTVLDVLFGACTHLSEHVGQILYIAKLRLGPAYRVLSTPHKKKA